MSVTTAELSFDRNIPRGIVHRESIAEVFLTDAHRTVDGAAFAAQLPRNHSYFSDHRGTAASYDALLLVEVFRQVAIYYAHTFLDVPRTEKFIFGAADFEILNERTLRIGACPGHCIVEAHVVHEKVRDGQVIGLTLEMVASIEGTVAAREAMTYQWMPSPVWKRIRDRGRESLGLPAQHVIPEATHVARMRPGSVGRHNPRNAILANPELVGDELSTLTIIDTNHPSLFDHALDHVPGMLVFEAARQIAMASANATLGLDTNRMVMHRLHMEFTKFGEFERDTHSRATVRPDGEGGALADVHLDQDGDVIAQGWVHLKLLPVDIYTMVA
ncbi:MAG: ScbA/BarX family gamma-butyrolactone biosynthesis protein [Corynebacteriales bacterium]|uniref:A-factor biosynthesis hotdog domain-containing protein n=1 Tax=Williamsia herbipolensis TaxID=1603258 RepID=A0AAU4JYS4_9NOCA|nr:ScbA/BarX family gamma-butyrolactone biosynthesis protein [Williamsia herbipolensis]MCX6469342.1 ScbA/BarX family gamma-butyrolactone biosynthesis protein [Mycobacteriales bacterium]